MLRLKIIIDTSTRAARPKLSKEPKVPSCIACTPPPQALIPTFIKLIPMSVTTIPETSGVIIFRVYFNKRLIAISTTDAAMQAPNMAGSPPTKPAEMIGPINEKLVP